MRLFWTQFALTAALVMALTTTWIAFGFCDDKGASQHAAQEPPKVVNVQPNALDMGPFWFMWEPAEVSPMAPHFAAD